MGNLELAKKKNLSPFRKIAIGTWSTPHDPSVYGTMTLRMEEAQRYLQSFREKTGKKLTYSHMMAKAAAAVFEQMPDANAILRFNRIYLRKRIGVFFQVAVEDEKTGEIDLSGAKIDDPEQKSLQQVFDEFSAKTAGVRKGKDKSLESSRNMFRALPFFMLNFFLKLLGFLCYTLNLNLKFAGVPKDPFGSIMITNIGTLGLEQAYVPLVPYSRVAILVAMGKVETVPVVEDGKLAVGTIMRISTTFDHRVLDGSHAAAMAKTLRKWMEHPFEHFDKL